MAKSTVKSFITSCDIPPSLIRSVIRQCGGWEYFQEIAKDVTDHGAAGGFSGFIYYTETLAFTKRNKKAIIEHAEQIAEECGESLLPFIAGFGCLKGTTENDIAKAIYQGKGDEATSVLNALAWFALECVALAYCQAEYGY